MKPSFNSHAATLPVTRFVRWKTLRLFICWYLSRQFLCSNWPPIISVLFARQNLFVWEKPRYSSHFYILDLFDCYTFCRNAHVKSVSVLDLRLSTVNKGYRSCSLAIITTFAMAEVWKKWGDVSFSTSRNIHFSSARCATACFPKKDLTPLRDSNRWPYEMRCHVSTHTYVHPSVGIYTDSQILFIFSTQVGWVWQAVAQWICDADSKYVHSRWSKMCEERSHWSPSKNKYLKRSTHVRTDLEHFACTATAKMVCVFEKRFAAMS
jgi:hypothetical protein